MLTRSSNFGSPFIDLDGGYKHNDKENDLMLRKIYYFFAEKPEFKEKAEPPFIPFETCKIKKVAYPTLGVIVFYNFY